MNKSEVLRHILHQAEGNPFANYWQRLAANARSGWGRATGKEGTAVPMQALMTFLGQHPEIASTLLGFLLPAMTAGKNRLGKALFWGPVAGGLGLAGKWAWDRRGDVGNNVGDFFGNVINRAADPVIKQFKTMQAQGVGLNADAQAQIDRAIRLGEQFAKDGVRVNLGFNAPSTGSTRGRLSWPGLARSALNLLTPKSIPDPRY